jgi:hypothetical protein
VQESGERFRQKVALTFSSPRNTGAVQKRQSVLLLPNTLGKPILAVKILVTS